MPNHPGKRRGRRGTPRPLARAMPRPRRPAQRPVFLGRPPARPVPCPPGCTHAPMMPPGHRPGRIFPQRKIISRQAAGSIPLYPQQD